MAVLPLVYEPSSVLRKVTDQIATFDENLDQLIDDMFETMYANHGCGLAAPQVGVSLALSVIDMEGKGENKIVIVNPKIVESSGEQSIDVGCLSVPGVSAKVKRFSKVKVVAQNQKGEHFEIEGEGMLSECLQHEIDHLNGKLFIDYLSPLKRKMLLEKSKKIKKRLKKKV